MTHLLGRVVLQVLGLGAFGRVAVQTVEALLDGHLKAGAHRRRVVSIELRQFCHEDIHCRQQKFPSTVDTPRPPTDSRNDIMQKCMHVHTCMDYRTSMKSGHWYMVFITNYICDMFQQKDSTWNKLFSTEYAWGRTVQTGKQVELFTVSECTLCLQLQL